MGFKNIKDFNMAFLGKQGQALLNNPTSLVAKVLKARYYPQTDFLSASLGSSLSYSWKSIWALPMVVLEGLRWRLGDGNRIHVWFDPWLRGGTKKLTKPIVNSFDPNLLLNDLIDRDSVSWKVELLDELQEVDDAIEAKPMPLINLQGEDKPIWRFSKDGTYTVRTTYHMFMEVFVFYDLLRVLR